MRSEPLLLALQLLLGLSLSLSPIELGDHPEPVLAIDLDEDPVVLDFDGARHQLENDHSVVLDLPQHEALHVVVDLPEDAVGLFVTIDGAWVDTIAAAGGFMPLDFEVLPTSGELGFEIAMPGQRAPTLPDVVVVTKDDDPDPR